MNPENEFLSWEGSFIAEESSFMLLPVGEYDFLIKNMERKYYDGAGSIPNGAPYAEVHLECTGPNGSSLVKDKLFLMKSWQWKLTQFFTSIGQAPITGQPFTPNWSQVIGSKGRLKIKINTSNNDPDKKFNNVDVYLEPKQPMQNSQTNFNQAPPVQNNQKQPSFNQPTQQQNNWSNPGTF